VLDALDEVARAAAAGARRVLVRVTPGIEAQTHEAIRTAQHGSKFGLPPDAALEALDRVRQSGRDPCGLHIHIG
jgi:diaminopimelate decarboxylase